MPLLFCKLNPVSFVSLFQLAGKLPISWLLWSSKWVNSVNSSHDAGISPENWLLPKSNSWIFDKPWPNLCGKGPDNKLSLQSNLLSLFKFPNALGKLPWRRLCSNLRTRSCDKFLNVLGISPSRWLWSKHRTSRCISSPKDAGISPLIELKETVRLIKLVREPSPFGKTPVDTTCESIWKSWIGTLTLEGILLQNQMRDLWRFNFSRWFRSGPARVITWDRRTAAMLYRITCWNSRMTDITRYVGVVVDCINCISLLFFLYRFHWFHRIELRFPYGDAVQFSQYIEEHEL